MGIRESTLGECVLVSIFVCATDNTACPHLLNCGLDLHFEKVENAAYVSMRRRFPFLSHLCCVWMLNRAASLELLFSFTQLQINQTGSIKTPQTNRKPMFSSFIVFPHFLLHSFGMGCKVQHKLQTHRFS